MRNKEIESNLTGLLPEAVRIRTLDITSFHRSSRNRGGQEENVREIAIFVFLHLTTGQKRMWGEGQVYV